MFYKVLMDNEIIDVIDGIQYCKYIKRSNLVLRCAWNERPEGIVSERLGKIFHVDGWLAPDIDNVFDGTVSLAEIDEDTFKELSEALASGETPSDGSLYDQTEEEPEQKLTLAQILKNRIAELEDENSQLRDEVLNTQMALCELYELVNLQ